MHERCFQLNPQVGVALYRISSGRGPWAGVKLFGAHAHAHDNATEIDSGGEGIAENLRCDQ